MAISTPVRAYGNKDNLAADWLSIPNDETGRAGGVKSIRIQEGVQGGRESTVTKTLIISETPH